MRAVRARDVLRYAALTAGLEGGNPAGVVLDARGMSGAAMLAIAAEVGYPETAFLVPMGYVDGASRYRVRFFSTVAEIPFCGHAAVAAAVALAERQGPGDLVFHIDEGAVPVRTSFDDTGALVATLTSVVPSVEEIVGHVTAPATIRILQGEDMGRPSQLRLDTRTAVSPLPQPEEIGGSK